MHFLISIRVASSLRVAPLTVAGSGTEETAMAPAAARPPLMNDLREILLAIALSPFAKKPKK
jgi:hypothetical protein